MIITFVHSQQSFLPEIEAYTNFFESAGITCRVVLPGEIGTMDTDIEWYFMGLDKMKSREGRVKIHEYTSASTAPLRGLKDLGKKYLNIKPDYRLFLNEYVRSKFDFKDNVPFGFRDMGIDCSWRNDNSSTGIYKYDFIYIGDLSPARCPGDLLDQFASGAMKERTLLIISHHYSSLQQSYKKYPNIIFEGPFPHFIIREKLHEAKYGINYMINKAPYNQQTSTKFLEYAASGLRIVSTAYQWAEEFSASHGGAYYFLKPDLSNLTWQEIEAFNYSSPDLSGFTWERQIKNSGVLLFIQSVFHDIQFPDTIT